MIRNHYTKSDIKYKYLFNPGEFLCLKSLANSKVNKKTMFIPNSLAKQKHTRAIDQILQPKPAS